MDFTLFWIRRLFLLTYLFFIGHGAFAQNWMQGYNFRKKIVIDKSSVSGAVNLLNFPVLITLEDATLKYLYGCGDGGLQHSKGLDISFAAVNLPAVPIHFQLDNYDPVKGRLVCWVRIDELIASGNLGENEIYLYYGANKLHRPFSAAAQSTWSNHYQKVWHMNLDIGSSIGRSANRDPGNNIKGSSMDSANFSEGRIALGVAFNGWSDGMSALPDTSTTICITAWVKVYGLGKEQVILENDSTDGGYKIKINAAGNVVFETIKTQRINSSTTTSILSPNTWYHLCFIFNTGLKKIYVNGTYQAGGGAALLKMGTGSSLSIGRSKQDKMHFNGMIDELRILNVERSLNWMMTEYRNQENPFNFIRVSGTENNPVQTEIVNEFTGDGGTSAWSDHLNWSYGEPPEPYANMAIKSGKTLKIAAEEGAIIGKMSLEAGSRLFIAHRLEVNCTASLAHTSEVTLEESGQIIFNGDVVNNGTINAKHKDASLSFRGDKAVQLFSGTGIATVSLLELKKTSATAELQLQSNVEISEYLRLTSGILHANGKIKLLAAGPNHAASVLPVQNVNQVSVLGNIHVQHYIDGNFPAPATARGWWLLSSPVYHSTAAGSDQYQLKAIQESIFVTGEGNMLNGFDPSPNHKPTIYIHDQALPGTLPQKYKGISDMNSQVPLGKGFYVFSRGSRMETDAYVYQIQGPLFSNPQPYFINFSGKLYIGNLRVDVFNKNMGAEGDGFNLLGNPYAAPLRWGSLQKQNLVPFLWIFDAKNNAYQVTDNPDYLIKSGSGFFVKVLNGYPAGSVTFTEAAKYTEPVSLVVPALSLTQGRFGFIAQQSIKVTLSKAGFSDTYILKLNPLGNDEVDDADAQKIGQGYLSIAGLAPNGNKLSIDERLTDTVKKEIRLSVQGWASGTYNLNLSATGVNGFILEDHYLKVKQRIIQAQMSYDFNIDRDLAETYGAERFSLWYEPPAPAYKINTDPKKDILVYPNPLNDMLYLKSLKQSYRQLKLSVISIFGKTILTWDVPLLETNVPLQFSCHQWIKGIYLLRLADPQTNKIIASFKVLKN